MTDDLGALAGVVRVARLRTAAIAGDGAAPLSTMVEPAHTVRADASLLRSVVQMNDASVRQFIVVDDAAASHLVGVISIGDFVRAHARMTSPVGDIPAGTRSLKPPTSRRARQWMVPAEVVPGATRFDALVERLLASPVNALIVESREGEFGIVLLEYVSELGRDDELQSVLIAADVARGVPTVAQSADLSAVVQAFSVGSPDALLVTEPGANKPIGLVTRTSLAEVLLEWYTTHLKAGSERNIAPRS